jgi:hypothetical protein
MATLATQEHEPAFGVEVEITADKPGRYIRIERPAAERNLTLAIQHRSAPHDAMDHWTWLTPQEARELSEALIVAATVEPEAGRRSTGTRNRLPADCSGSSFSNSR